jgi:hypothetical protein
MSHPIVEALVRKWAPMLEGLTREEEIKNMATLLENEDRYFSGTRPLFEAGQGGSHTLSNPTDVGTQNDAGGGTVDQSTMSGIARYKRIAIPLVRRVFPELLANQLVGVQPMTGPVGLAYALRFRSNTTGMGYGANAELGYNNIVPSFTSETSAGITGMSSLFGEKLNENLGHFGSGTGAVPDEVSSEVGLTVENKEIKARTRKLKARWTVEAQQDLAAMHNIDLEEEMMDLMAYEIAAEIDREIVARIVAAARAGGILTWNYQAGSGTGGDPTAVAGGDARWEQERFRTLFTVILTAAEEIARATRRGAGNYVIVSPRVAVAIQSLPEFDTSPVNMSLNSLSVGISTIGTINGLKVYRDTHAWKDYAVVGYKGAKENDAGIIYAPYIPVMFAKATGEESFSPRAGVMTRYGVCDHLFGSQNYYRFIDVQGLNAGSLAPSTGGIGLKPFFDSSTVDAADHDTFFGTPPNTGSLSL